MAGEERTLNCAFLYFPGRFGPVGKAKRVAGSDPFVIRSELHTQIQYSSVTVMVASFQLVLDSTN